MLHRTKLRDSAGFTAPELVTALVVMFVLLAIMGFALRPKSYEQPRYQAEQRLNLAIILQGINRYQAAHNGALPEGITQEFQFIGSQEAQLNLCRALVPAYLKDMPLDTRMGAKAYSPVDEQETVTDEHNQRSCDRPNMIYTAGYAIAKDAEGRVRVAVLGADFETPVLQLSQK